MRLEIIKCKCGCGQERNRYYRGKEKFYITGHHILSKKSRINMMLSHLGKPLSEEHRKNIGLANLGNKHTEETIKKLRLANLGEKNPMYGKPHTEEHNKKISLSISGEKHPMYGKCHTEETIKKMKENHWSKKSDYINPFKGKHPSEETRKKQRIARLGIYIGDKSPRWLGGKSFEPYTLDFNKHFKESIRNRDNYCCVVCNKPQEELGYKLSVHHIDYDKKNTFEQNCVSLCRNHHIETNTNRKSWTAFFQSLLKERYNYEYTEDQKIILDFTKSEGGI